MSEEWEEGRSWLGSQGREGGGIQLEPGDFQAKKQYNAVIAWIHDAYRMRFGTHQTIFVLRNMSQDGTTQIPHGEPSGEAVANGVVPS